MTARSYVSLSKKQSKCTLKSLDETRRLNIDLLGLCQLFAEVFCLHDIELGDEWVNRLTLLVDIARIFKLSTQMQQLLDLMLVLKNTVAPTLKKLKAFIKMTVASNI